MIRVVLRKQATEDTYSIRMRTLRQSSSYLRQACSLRRRSRAECMRLRRPSANRSRLACIFAILLDRRIESLSRIRRFSLIEFAAYVIHGLLERKVLLALAGLLFLRIGPRLFVESAILS